MSSHNLPFSLRCDATQTPNHLTGTLCFSSSSQFRTIVIFGRSPDPVDGAAPGGFIIKNRLPSGWMSHGVPEVMLTPRFVLRFVLREAWVVLTLQARKETAKGTLKIQVSDLHLRRVRRMEDAVLIHPGRGSNQQNSKIVVSAFT